MRDIKFRGLTDRGFWVFGNLIKDKYNAIIETGMVHCKVDSAEFESDHPFEVDFNSVGQFTGLHDKNGKKIYEGDIVYENYENQTIVFDKEYASFRAVGKSINSGLYHQQFEIIGNIHENKDLLK